jgi:hypothetical protein
MKKTRRTRIWALLVVASLLVSCALPMSSTPTQFVFPTPNMTMTALFQIPPTATPAPEPTKAAEASATPAATATPAVTQSPTAANCTNLAAFISETIGDLSYMAPGTAFVKTWTLKNVGTCTWGSGYALAFDSGDQMGAPNTVPLTVSVPPNAQVTLSVNLTAPATSGQYKGYWKMQSPQSAKFGIGTGGANSFWVYITTVVLPPPCAAKDQRPSANGELTEAYYEKPVSLGGVPVVIDGVLNEWDLPLIDSVDNEVFGSTDNKARFSLKWDAEYLYLALMVEDDIFVQETSGGANMYLGDSIEMEIDTNLKGDYCNTAIDSDDYQLGISPGYLQDPTLRGPGAWLWWPSSIAGPKVVDVAAAFTVAPDPAGYIIEARFPWQMFGNPLHLGGEYYGWALSVSDNDHAGTTKQEGMISTAPKRTTWNNPTLWGTLQIELKPGP